MAGDPLDREPPTAAARVVRAERRLAAIDAELARLEGRVAAWRGVDSSHRASGGWAVAVSWCAAAARAGAERAPVQDDPVRRGAL